MGANKKLLVEINHPAHYHLFKNISYTLLRKGFDILWVVRDKDVVLELVANDRDVFTIYSKGRKEHLRGLFKNIRWILDNDAKILRYALKFKPSLFLSSSVSASHIGRLLQIPSILMTEDDISVIPLMAVTAFPFANCIIAPRSCRVGLWKYKGLQYEGYHELAYLHPDNFAASKRRVKFVSLKEDFFILRFALLSAHHDRGKHGITTSVALKLIKLLEKHGKIFITSERELEPEFEKYRIQIDPGDIHHALYYAKMYIGDSQTMAAEAAVLGTPAIRFNDFVGKLGYLEELEHTYGLTYGIKTSQPQKLYAKVEELLEMPELKQQWLKRRKKMLSEKIDLTAFMVWLIENYPKSIQTLKKNPDYQYTFK